MKPWIDSPRIVGIEVEVHLCDHNPVEKNVNCGSDKEGTLASKNKASQDVGRSKRLEHTQILPGSSLQATTSLVLVSKGGEGEGVCEVDRSTIPSAHSDQHHDTDAIHYPGIPHHGGGLVVDDPKNMIKRSINALLQPSNIDAMMDLQQCLDIQIILLCTSDVCLP